MGHNSSCPRSDLSGLRSAAPYVLSFVNSLYWNARTKYVFECKSLEDDPEVVDLITIPNASLCVVDGEVNVLLVLVDREVKSNGQIFFDLAGQPAPVIGSSD